MQIPPFTLACGATFSPAALGGCAFGMVALNLARLIILHGSVLVALVIYLHLPSFYVFSVWLGRYKSSLWHWCVHGWLIHVQETLWSLVHPWLVLVCIRVLVTFRRLWSCPLALPLGLPCLRGLPLWVWLDLFGYLPPWFPFVAVLVGFSLGCLHLWCGLGALASRRHVVVCSRWAFALGVHGVLSWWAAAAAAVAAPSLCAVYLGAVQVKVHTLR